ncbi:threonine aldolase family protein [Neotabrizicola sp. VNH66]|uniref:threonine aldolase family protein n=1 Tax=Neotabrizicola sp. VNH66 TaxID=3400918 RepID=UPI003BFD3CB1
MPLIDLASDAATQPTPPMRAAMAAAPVGDEQRGEDPTTAALEERVAALLGQEKALFLPSGTMANQIAFLVHCRPGDEILCAANAHVYGSEGAGAAVLAGAQLRPIETGSGIFTAATAEAALRTPRARSPRSRVIAVEQTTNRGGGLIWAEHALREMRALADRHGLALHMDGARVMNAAVAAGVPAADFGAPCHSVWLDLSKGLGCPVGAVLAGSAAFIEEAWVWKHRLGGAMRQSGILSAAGLYALDHHIDRLAEDHANAAELAAGLSQVPGLTVWPAVTNLVFIDTSASGIPAAALMAELAREGLRIKAEGAFLLRAVTHLDISAAEIIRATTLIAQTVARLRGQPGG